MLSVAPTPYLSDRIFDPPRCLYDGFTRDTIGDSYAVMMDFLKAFGWPFWALFGFASLFVGYCFLANWMEKKNISTSALDKTIIGIPALIIAIPLIAIILLVPVLREMAGAILCALVIWLLAGMLR